MESVLGPLFRVICLVIALCAWLPVVIMAYIQWRFNGSPENK